LTDIGFLVLALLGPLDIGFLRIVGLSFGYWFDWCFTTNQLLTQTYRRRVSATRVLMLQFLS